MTLNFDEDILSDRFDGELKLGWGGWCWTSQRYILERYKYSIYSHTSKAKWAFNMRKKSMTLNDLVRWKRNVSFVQGFELRKLGWTLAKLLSK